MPQGQTYNMLVLNPSSLFVAHTSNQNKESLLKLSIDKYFIAEPDCLPKTLVTLDIYMASSNLTLQILCCSDTNIVLKWQAI